MYLPEIDALTRTDPVVVGGSADALASVNAPDIALALWTRPAPFDLGTVDLATIDDLSFCVTEAAPVTALCDAGYPAGIADALAEDISQLAAVHRRLTGSAVIKVRLDVIETDACRRFHADYVTLRMLCTYRGAGTQWCRATEPGVVHELAAGTVGIFKGRVAMADPTILHRSPPLEIPGGQRLLLVLDPA